MFSFFSLSFRPLPVVYPAQAVFTMKRQPKTNHWVYVEGMHSIRYRCGEDPLAPMENPIDAMPCSCCFVRAGLCSETQYELGLLNPDFLPLYPVF
jgi:hypothetical protein